MKEVSMQYQNQDNFPERIEYLVNKLNGPSEFARKTGVTLSTITRWRKGEADPSRSHLEKKQQQKNRQEALSAVRLRECKSC